MSFGVPSCPILAKWCLICAEWCPVQGKMVSHPGRLVSHFVSHLRKMVSHPSQMVSHVLSLRVPCVRSVRSAMPRLRLSWYPLYRGKIKSFSSPCRPSDMSGWSGAQHQAGTMLLTSRLHLPHRWRGPLTRHHLWLRTIQADDQVKFALRCRQPVGLILRLGVPDGQGE